MDKRTDVLIIGGGPAGIVCASTAKKYYPDKKITVMRNVQNSVVPCGIPYMFYSLQKPEDNKMGYAGLENAGIEVLVDEAVNINRKEKYVETKGGDRYYYEKLVLATGSLPIIPKIPGIEKKNIFPIYKNLDYLKEVVEEIRKSKNVLILGGGFIGVEIADEVSKLQGINVYLVEMLPHLLAQSFDEEFSILVEEKLKSKGVNVLTNAKVVEFIGDEKVRKVRLEDGREIDVDVVLLGIGARPNSELAKTAGLEVINTGAIWVDEYMRTSDPDIFAVGDCALKRDFYTRRNTAVMLASTATAEARIAGANLYKIKLIRENKGTIAVYSTYVDGLVLASAGLTENSAMREGFEVVTGIAEGIDKHPGTLPGVNKTKVKLIFSKHSGVLLGGQIAGGMSFAELINLIGLAIQQRITASELETLQMATHPYLTCAPTVYHVVMAAQEAIKKIYKDS
ncbi:MAG: FAD-dependent oxidoreductase [Dictyoglomus thermophilum]